MYLLSSWGGCGGKGHGTHSKDYSPKGLDCWGSRGKSDTYLLQRLLAFITDSPCDLESHFIQRFQCCFFFTHSNLFFLVTLMKKEFVIKYINIDIFNTNAPNYSIYTGLLRVLLDKINITKDIQIT